MCTGHRERTTTLISLNLPFVIGGLGHGGRAHAPNEYIVVEEGGLTGGLATLEKSYVAILNNLARI